MLSASLRAALAVNNVTTNGWSLAGHEKTVYHTEQGGACNAADDCHEAPCPASIAATTPPRATRAPTERSIPLRITTVMPSVTIASMLFCRMMFMRLEASGRFHNETMRESQTKSRSSGPCEVRSLARRLLSRMPASARNVVVAMTR